MNDYIKREDAIESIKPMVGIWADDGRFYVDYQRVLDIINNVPSVTFLEAFENYRIEGFNLKELTLFADSCRRNGVTDKELHGWALNVGRAYDYLLGKMQEQLDEYITGGGKE